MAWWWPRFSLAERSGIRPGVLYVLSSFIIDRSPTKSACTGRTPRCISVGCRCSATSAVCRARVNGETSTHPASRNERRNESSPPAPEQQRLSYTPRLSWVLSPGRTSGSTMGAQWGGRACTVIIGHVDQGAGRGRRYRRPATLKILRLSDPPR
jgi:hypothetical protein